MSAVLEMRRPLGVVRRRIARDDLPEVLERLHVEHVEARAVVPPFEVVGECYDDPAGEGWVWWSS